MKIQIHLERGGKGAPDLVNLVENEEEVEEGSVRDEIHGAPLITPEDTPEYLRLVERNMAADQVADMTVLKNEASDNKVGEGTAETPIVTMETPNTTACGPISDKLSGAWEAVNRASKRTIIVLMAILIILIIVIIAIASKPASSHDLVSESVWSNIRLPGSVVPSHYDVRLNIDMTNEYFTGSEEVYVTVTEETSVLLIHVSNIVDEELGPEMNVTQHSVHRLLSSGRIGGSMKVTKAFIFSENSFLVMQMSHKVKPGDYVLKFQWEARLVKGLDGIYISNYKDKDGVEKKLLASQMEPLAARKVMPCFDEPDFKATFSMEIITEGEYGLVLWNMPQKGETERVDDKWNKYTFDKSVVMSTYLLAFIVADFKCTDVQVTNTDVKVRTCGRNEPIERGDGDYSATKTKEIIMAYETFYGTEFPLTKIDSVAVPDFSAGAMENWGLILYRETALLYNPEKDTYTNKARVAVVVAHELAHQWFGNLVTMKWWNDLWLNEGFASYVEWIGTDAAQPKWHYLDFQTYTDRTSALSIDSYTSSRPTSVDVEEPADITAQFDSISYSKGCSILVQAKMFMDLGKTDSQNFENAIRKYIKEFEFSNTVQNDLYQKMEEVNKEHHPDSPVNIVDVMDTWTLQMNFPVVQVRRYDDKNLIISQRRFLISDGDTSTDKPSPYGYQWFVPIMYKIKDDETVFEWLKPHSTIIVPFDFSDEDNLIRLNMGSAGYYIVDYSYELTKRLQKNLNTAAYDDLTTGDRQGMLNDIFLLISEGSKPIDDGLALVDLMAAKELKTDSLVPLQEITRQIGSVAGHVSGDETLLKKWKKKNAPLAVSMYDTYAKDFFKTEDGGAESELPTDESEYGFQKRRLVPFSASIGCIYQVEGCIAASQEKFNKYRGEGVELPPDFRGTILNTVMSMDTTTEEDWDFLWEKSVNSTSEAETSTMRYALGLIPNKDVLRKFAGYCMDSDKVRRSDALYLLGRSIPQTKLGREVAWQYMQDSWDEIVRGFADSLFGVEAYIGGVLSGFSDQDSLNDIEDFFSTRMESLGSGKAAYLSAVQSIKSRIAWLDKNKASVEESVKDITLP